MVIVPCEIRSGASIEAAPKRLAGVFCFSSNIREINSKMMAGATAEPVHIIVFATALITPA
jgi:hypothetical protein